MKIDAIKVSMKKTENKNICFEYLIDVLAKKNKNGLIGFSTLKLIKLLFFVVGVSSSEKNEGLTSIFDNFVAMPFGPVESDIYNEVQHNRLQKYLITSSKCDLKKDIKISISRADKEQIENAVNLLLTKNPNILNCEPFELVDITHKWSCWQICFDLALSLNKRSVKIPSRMIQKSIKYYQ